MEKCKNTNEAGFTKHFPVPIAHNIQSPENSETVYSEELVKIQCRFFNRENLIVNYDYKTGKLSCEIE